MKALIAALAALTFTAGAASAADVVTRADGQYRGYIFVKADLDNDGRLTGSEIRRAKTLTRLEQIGDR